jgi:hypothetical protein
MQQNPDYKSDFLLQKEPEADTSENIRYLKPSFYNFGKYEPIKSATLLRTKIFI